MPTNTSDGGIIGMRSWLDAPAGKYGFIRNEEDKLVLKTEKKVNYGEPIFVVGCLFVKPRKLTVSLIFFSKYGINAVRFHKFSWYAYHNNKSTEFDPEKFERFDYFQHVLREKGIYYGWSHIYGHRVMPVTASVCWPIPK